MIDPNVTYQAHISRDGRYDGRYFAAVVTTGIYCRSVCRVRAPKPENILYFSCAAAAEAAGFRPCMRCRPDSSPGTPAWHATVETVSRALRLIADGALDDGGSVDALAARLGVSARQLRRLFGEHLGATPVEVAAARRSHFARRLIDETDLPMAQIAFAAGFDSVRQFNHAMRDTFRHAPTELRKRRSRRRAPHADDDALMLRLSYRPPLDWRGMARFLAARAIPGVEDVSDGAYRRTIVVDGQPGVLELTPEPGESYLTFRLWADGQHGLIDVVERARRIFDLSADPLAVTERLATSPALVRLAARHGGMRVPGAWDPFELAVRAVLGQQVTVQGATTLAGRLVHAFGAPVQVGEHASLTHVFPSAADLAEADVASIGLPAARAETVRALARTVAGGTPLFDASAGLDATVARLCELPGIGEWTAHYIAMRALGERDAFPASDLGLRKALSPDGTAVSASELSAQGEAWRPWRAYAAMWLWSSLSDEKGARHAHRNGNS
jgi:AraC family transcriptional regulator of adaptative response / DNA-3-methyladenine glycosylase II